MAQILEPSQENLLTSTESSQNNDSTLQIATISEENAPKPVAEITEEVAKSFKGRIPTGMRDQVVAFNKQQKIAALKAKRLSAVRQKKNGDIVQREKLDLFLQEFLKNGGNATQAAASVFNVSSMSSAATLGSYYLKRAKLLGRIYLERKGYGYGRMLDIAMKKAEESRLPDWWDRVMKVTDYGDFMAGSAGKNQPSVVNIVQTEKELFQKYNLSNATAGEIIEEENALEEEVAEIEEEASDN